METYFREQEQQFIANVDTNQNLVVSTGGGAPCFFDNMDVMNEKGFMIHLNRNRKKQFGDY